MDFALLSNLFLFLGAFGVSLFTQLDDGSSTPDDSDPLYDRNDYSDTRNGTAGDDTETADQDNLAWFLNGGDDDLTGSSTADYANLGSGDDTAYMAAGNDIVVSGSGDDLVKGGVGNDQIFGDDGNDALEGDTGTDALQGDAGNDTLTGGSGSDILAGGDGDDTLSGFAEGASATTGMTTVEGADSLSGGNGNDTLLLGRGDTGTGGAGADLFQLDNRWRDATTGFGVTDFNLGEDSLHILYLPTYSVETGLEIPPDLRVTTTADGTGSLISLNGAVIATLEGVTGLTEADVTLVADTETDPGYIPANYDEVHTGTEGDDTVSTGSGSSGAFFMGGGDDSLQGGDQADYARMGAGDDTAMGGDGADTIYLDEGDDTAAGDAGNDQLGGGTGNDDLDGGSGIDRLLGEEGADLLTGGLGSDYLGGGTGDDTISGYDQTDGGVAGETLADGIDTLSGGDGNDTLLMGQRDSASGGAGNDLFRLDNGAQDASTSFAISDFRSGEDRLELTYFPQYSTETGLEIPPVVTVTVLADGSGSLIAINGATVVQISGSTNLSAADIDLIRDDVTDPDYIAANYSDVQTGPADSGAAATGLSGSTAFFMGSGADTVTGSEAGDYASAGAGDDELAGEAGNDIIKAEGGDDTVTGGDGTDALLGGDVADAVSGDAGNDRALGEDGDDIVTGGDGADFVAGGAGDDTIGGYGVDAGGADSLGATIDGLDTLQGGDGDDRMVMGQGDSAYGGAGADQFSLDMTWDQTAPAAVIHDYGTGDQIGIVYAPVFDGAGVEIPPVLTVTQTGAPDFVASVLLNGQEVARVLDASGLVAGDIVLTAG